MRRMIKVCILIKSIKFFWHNGTHLSTEQSAHVPSGMTRNGWQRIQEAKIYEPEMHPARESQMMFFYATEGAVFARLPLFLKTCRQETLEERSLCFASWAIVMAVSPGVRHQGKTRSIKFYLILINDIPLYHNSKKKISHYKQKFQKSIIIKSQIIKIFGARRFHDYASYRPLRGDHIASCYKRLCYSPFKGR